MTNGEAGYVPIINNGINKSNLIRYGLTGTVGTGIALTKNSIEDNNTIGTEIFGDNLVIFLKQVWACRIQTCDCH